MAANTIDKTTKITLGLWMTILGALCGGVVYITALNSNIIQLVETTKEVRKAIDRNTEQLVHDGKALAVLETLVTTIERRVDLLEKGNKKN